MYYIYIHIYIYIYIYTYIYIYIYIHIYRDNICPSPKDQKYLAVDGKLFRHIYLCS